MHAINLVVVNRPTPFVANPSITMTLRKDWGTSVQYIQTYDADQDIQELEERAQALRDMKEISQEILDSNWKLDIDAMEEEDAYLIGNNEQNIADSNFQYEIEDEPNIDLAEPV
jgi:hypothetical protein